MPIGTAVRYCVCQAVAYRPVLVRHYIFYGAAWYPVNFFTSDQLTVFVTLGVQCPSEVRTAIRLRVKNFCMLGQDIEKYPCIEQTSQDRLLFHSAV